MDGPNESLKNRWLLTAAIAGATILSAPLAVLWAKRTNQLERAETYLAENHGRFSITSTYWRQDATQQAFLRAVEIRDYDAARDFKTMWGVDLDGEPDNPHNQPPVIVFAMKGRWDAVRALRDQGADIDPYCARFMISMASSGHYEDFKEFAAYYRTRPGVSLEHALCSAYREAAITCEKVPSHTKAAKIALWITEQPEYHAGMRKYGAVSAASYEALFAQDMP